MPKSVVAKKNHGKCDVCPNDIKPGESYVRVLRRPTEEERNDPNLRTVNLFGQGQQVSVKRHTECNRRAYPAASRRSDPGTSSLGSLLP